MATVFCLLMFSSPMFTHENVKTGISGLSLCGKLQMIVSEVYWTPSTTFDEGNNYATFHIRRFLWIASKPQGRLVTRKRIYEVSRCRHSPVREACKIHGRTRRLSSTRYIASHHTQLLKCSKLFGNLNGHGTRRMQGEPGAEYAPRRTRHGHRKSDWTKLALAVVR